MVKVSTINSIGKGIAAIFYLEPIVWYIWGLTFGDKTIFRLNLGLWYLPSNSATLVLLGRSLFLIVIAMSTLVGALILMRKSFTLRKVAYADAIILIVYLSFICSLFPLENKWKLVENFMTGRFCLLSILWSEVEHRRSLTAKKEV